MILLFISKFMFVLSTSNRALAYTFTKIPYFMFVVSKASFKILGSNILVNRLANIVFSEPGGSIKIKIRWPIIQYQ
jgi:hypothetical protein